MSERAPQREPAEELIRHTPGVCGGSACVRTTRVAVWMLAALWERGATDAHVLDGYEQLTPADLAAAKAYWRSHRPEIERELRRSRGE